VGHGNNGIEAQRDESGIPCGHHTRYRVAETAQGKLVAYERTKTSTHRRCRCTNPEEMRDADIDRRYPRNIIAETAAASGDLYEIGFDILAPDVPPRTVAELSHIGIHLLQDYV
jgi:hypothetical protein